MGNPVRVGVLGCAWIVQNAVIDVLPNVPEIEVAAFASRDPSKADTFALLHGSRSVRDYDALLTDPALDAIYIPLPNSMHCDWTLRALEAGKAVLCEKPLAANAIEAQRMVDAATSTGGILMEAFHWRYHPLTDRLTAILDEGVLGDLQRVDVEFLLPRAMVPADNIRWRHDLGGGATMDTGCYCVNFLRMVLGEPEHIIKATATIESNQVDARMQAELRFSNNCVGSIDASQITELDTVVANATLVGSRGRLHATMPFMPQHGGRIELEIDGRRTQEDAEATTSYVFQARAFAEAVRKRTPIRTSASDALANMRVIDAIYRAAGMLPRGVDS